MPQRIQDLPTSVTVLDREMIKASGARDISDLMRLVPGFQTFAHTTVPTRVTYHGLTDDDFSPRLQVLIDGRSQYSPLFESGVNWAMLPVAIEDIERIELVRGTNSAAFGTNAFMGVVNIITLDPALIKSFSVSTNYGNQGVRDYTLRTGSQLGESGNFRFTYQQKDDQALPNRADWADAFRSRLLDLRADFQLSNADVLRLSAGRVEAHLPMGALGDPGTPLHDFAQSNTYLQAHWNHVISDKAEFSVRYAYTRDRANDNFVGYYQSANFNNGAGVYYRDGSFTGSSSRHELEAQHTIHFFDTFRLAWGAGYRADELQSEANFHGNPRYTRSVLRQFGNLEWRPITWFTGNLGASFDQDSLSGNSVSPRVSASFHLSPDHTIRLGAAKATRSSSIATYKGEKWFEVFRDGNGPVAPGQLFQYGFYADPNTPRERMTSLDIGYLGTWRELGASLDVRLFREEIGNRLLLANRTLSQFGLCDMICSLYGGVSTADFYTPAQDIRIEGLEYQWQWRPQPSTRLVFGQSYTRIRARFLESYLNDQYIAAANYYLSPDVLDTDRRLAEQSAPHLSSTLMLMQKLPWSIDFSLMLYQQGGMKWTRNSTTEGYTRVDARIAYPFKLGSTRGELALTAQSLNGSHGEFRSTGEDKDRIVTRRQWLSLGFEL